MELNEYRAKIADLVFEADQDILVAARRVNMPLPDYLKKFGRSHNAQRMLVLVEMQKRLQEALKVLDGYSEYLGSRVHR